MELHSPKCASDFYLLPFAPSSQLCSHCGNQQKMPLSVRTYECPACGFIADRDYNAAVNILNIGMAGTAITNACGDTTNSFQSYA